MGDGRADTQRVWHEHVGALLDGKTILDVGAGYGLSKARLANGGRNRVTTQDIERSLMERVDLICEVRDLGERSWDVATAIDVIEHVPDASRFLGDLRRKVRLGVFMTTPAHRMYPHPWHFTPEQIEALARIVGVGQVYFARYKAGDVDEIRDVDREVWFSDPSIYAHGVYVLV